MSGTQPKRSSDESLRAARQRDDAVGHPSAPSETPQQAGIGCFIRRLRISPELANILDHHSESIQTAWATQLHNLPGSDYQRGPLDELSSWTSRGVAAVIDTLKTGSCRALETHASDVSQVRGQLGFDIGEVICGMLTLKEVALPYVLEASRQSSTTAQMLSDLDSCVDLMVGHFGKLHAAALRESVEIEKQRAMVLLDAVAAASGSIDLETVFQRVVGSIASAMKACCCILLADGNGGGLRSQFVAKMEDGDDLPEHLKSALDPQVNPLVAALGVKREPVVYRGSGVKRLLGESSFGSLRITAVAALPILRANRSLAVALALHSNNENAFDSEETQFAMAIVNAVAPTLDHALLYEESNHSLAESRARQQITTAVLDRSGLPAVLEIVCRETQHLIGAGGVAVLLLEEKGQLRVGFGVGDAAMSADRLLRELSPAGESVVPVEPMLINDIIESELASPEASKVQSMLVVPLCVHGKVIGALQIVNKEQGFENADIHMANLIADQVAMAIEHVRLHEQQEKMAVLEERQRLARELHDSVTQSIYGVSTLAEAAARLLDVGQVNEAAEHLRNLRNAAVKGLREMRHLIFELHPPDVRRLGLVATLQARLAGVEGRAGLETEFSCEGVAQLPQDIEEGLYKIAQEAFNNSVKHAKATKISLSLSRTSTGVVLEIVDDGLGFDLAIGRSKGGLGLRGMEERTAQMNGKLSISSQAGQGTRISIEIPIPEDSET